MGKGKRSPDSGSTNLRVSDYTKPTKFNQQKTLVDTADEGLKNKKDRTRGQIIIFPSLLCGDNGCLLFTLRPASGILASSWWIVTPLVTDLFICDLILRQIHFGCQIYLTLASLSLLTQLGEQGTRG